MQQAEKIAVVGAGIIGCSTAWALARRGFSVILLDERPSFLQGISSAGFGSLTPFSDPFYRGEARAFAAKAVDLYRNGWLKEICNASGQTVAFSDAGLLQLCLDDMDVAKGTAQATELTAAGFKARMQDEKETRRLEPALIGSFKGSLWMDEPWLDRQQYYSAVGAALKTEARIEQRFDDAVIEVRSHPSMLTVITRAGREIECGGAVVCNALSPVAITGVPSFPLKWVRGDALSVHTTNGKPLLKRHVYCHEGFITPRQDSELLLGATYEPEDLPSSNARNHRDRIVLSDFQRIVAANRVILPQIESLEVAQVWRNWRPTAPDNSPILGAVSSDSRLLIANGFIGLGLTLSPAVGDSIARYFSQVDSLAFPQTFSPNRQFQS